VIPPRERLLQLARLVGLEAFSERFGPPQTAGPDADALRALIEERLDDIARRLVEEAAASDDIIDGASAQAYLDDRLHTLRDLLTPREDALLALLLLGYQHKEAGALLSLTKQQVHRTHWSIQRKAVVLLDWTVNVHRHRRVSGLRGRLLWRAGRGVTRSSHRRPPCKRSWSGSWNLSNG